MFFYKLSPISACLDTYYSTEDIELLENLEVGNIVGEIAIRGRRYSKTKGIALTADV
jgi:hypothetical protein